MKITKDNYFSEIDKISADELPEELLQAHELISDRTESGRDWSIYTEDAQMKDVINLAFEKLGELIEYRHSLSSNEEELGAIHKQRGSGYDPKIHDPSDAARNLIEPYVLRGDDISSISKSMLGANTGQYAAHIKGGKIYVTEFNNKKINKTFSLMDVFQEIRMERPGSLPKRTEANEEIKQKASKENLKAIVANETERISEEVRFIKRFASLHNKVKEKKQLLGFISSLQRAMLEKRIRKTSEYAKEILFMQETLLKIYNGMGSEIKIDLGKNTVEKFSKMSKSEKVRPSVQFIKRYISIQGKPDKAEQGGRLCEAMERAAKKRIITSADP